MRNKARQHNSKINTCVQVTDKECGGNAEKMVRRFIKKVKREGIVEEIRERRHFTKPTIVRAEKKRNTKRLIEKINKQRDELFTTTKTRFKRRK
jgi:ribosomal protein S21|tara:strand:- start:367 stop:648 length:282 start_codon:yes stop_codon:yes gene_type:complete